MASHRFAVLLCAALLGVWSGCATTPGDVPLRADGTPGPEPCPEKAKEVMGYLRMFVGESAWVQLDANQALARPITLYEGPIESVIDEDIGLFEAPARLYGRVWTGGPQPTIRYYEGQSMKGGPKIPLCAVARMGFGQLRKRLESKPGTAIIDVPRAGVYIVDEFR